MAFWQLRISGRDYAESFWPSLSFIHLFVSFFLFSFFFLVFGFFYKQYNESVGRWRKPVACVRWRAFPFENVWDTENDGVLFFRFFFISFFSFENVLPFRFHFARRSRKTCATSSEWNKTENKKTKNRTSRWETHFRLRLGDVWHRLRAIFSVS